MLYGVPMRQESYSVAARKLTPDELNSAAYQIAKDARIYYDDPGVWPSFEMFLAFQVGKQAFRYVYDSTREEHEEFVKLVFKHAGIPT